MSNRAWVTLATNDSYGLGALVLAHSLRRAGSSYPAVVLITPAVTDAMKERLRAVFVDVVLVDVLDSGDAAHLALLQRPELGITFTKIHCWNLTQYEKCVFLDADTLVVQNCDELFEREELSAAPDVGWPDCFNSGVFVYKPSKETFDAIIKFAKERGSFDGGDQGLLNSFFSNWARGDINKHLPFLYNVTSAAFYSYLPALKHFGQDMKIIHFIGTTKPWLQSYNWTSHSVDVADHLKETLQLWWDIFVSSVHPQLDTTMSGVAGNLARVVPGAPSQGEALDELSRRQGWEAGNIDYMGADSFANIWAKISQTLNQAPKQPSPPKERTPPPKQQSPPKDLTPSLKEPTPPKEQPAVVVETKSAETSPKLEAEDLVSAKPIPINEESSAAPTKEDIKKEPDVTKSDLPLTVCKTESKTPVQPEPEQTKSKSPSALNETKPGSQVQSELTKSELPSDLNQNKTQTPLLPEAPTEKSTTAKADVVKEPPKSDQIVEKLTETKPKEKTELVEVPPTPPASPKSTPDQVSTPVTEIQSPVEILAICPTKAEEPIVATPTTESGEKVEQKTATVIGTPATSKIEITPEKSLDSSAASSDSPPLANTPAKEEVPPPVAKLEGEKVRKSAGKLQLVPPSVADPLPTPDSELEDAATLAQSIIASELATPTVTSPTPPAPLTPSSPPLAPLLSEKRLSVDELPPDTPPAGPVSLSQIGVKPKPKSNIAAQIESSITEKAPESPTTGAEPDASSLPSKKKVVKKVVKKEVPTAVAADAPVPPPRKKEKKPKDK